MCSYVVYASYDALCCLMSSNKCWPHVFCNVLCSLMFSYVASCCQMMSYVLKQLLVNRALFCLVLPCVVLGCLVLSYVALCRLILSYIIKQLLATRVVFCLTCIMLSYVALCCLTLSYEVLGCLMSSYVALCCLMLSYVVLCYQAVCWKHMLCFALCCRMLS